MSRLPLLDVKKNINNSPHVVILGAGASLAAVPKGDANGRKLPLLKNLIDIVGLRSLLDSHGLNIEGGDFEILYDELVTSGAYPQLVNQLEMRVFDYFSNLRLPTCATIYDYLVLSLRKKDMIASFNWDPFLVQAYLRNKHVAELPHLVFLHGNVAIDLCREHKRSGFYGQQCGICGKKLEPSRLLYPVKHKDYNSDGYIKDEWDRLRWFLNQAYFVTIFGYSAPVTDVEARTLMLKAWKNNPTLSLAEVEIVDVKPRKQLEETWREFFYSHHYGISSNIFRSYLFMHPRRSCEAFAMASLQNEPWVDNKFPRRKKLANLHEWIRPLIVEEQREVLSGNPC